ncbi:MAG: helix-turn-helix domain-containing protein [Parvibaculum sp.]|nr:helix-turn-helix domain-containing protein [Parvibaculum sp.]
MEALISWLNEQRGRRSRLSETLGIVPSALSQWDRVPAERVLDVERITGISRHDLRPDIYGASPAEAAQ